MNVAQMMIVAPALVLVTVPSMMMNLHQNVFKKSHAPVKITQIA